MYLRFDGSITTSQGVPPETPPATTFVPGKFGMGAVLAGANGALYYVVSDAGVPYPMTAGTMAMWFKPQWTWPSATGRVIWKPVVDRGGVSNQAGPYMAASAEAFFGTVNTNPDGGTVGAVSTGAQLTPYWKNADWNHLAETWSQSAPTLTFTLNGATGDATVTHVEANDGWVRQFPNVGYVRLASNGSPSDGQYDDVAMWNRALSLAEVQAIYSANKPIGDLCGL